MSDTVVTAKFVADTSSLQSGVKKAATGIRGLEGDVKKAAGGFTVLKGAVGAALGVAAVGAITSAARAMKQYATDAVAAAQESLVTERRLENIARSMGVLDGALGGTTQRLTDYADSLRAQTGVNDETIKSAQAMILTFEAVAKTAGESGGMFDRATAAALDLAAAGFGSIESNAVRLARALQDPIKGMTALTRSGVTFTQQERETIKTLVESGRQFEAQNVIMQAVEKQVGGTAAATATNAAKMASAFEEVQESIGFALLPAVESVAGAILTHAVPALNDFAEEAKTTMGPQLAESFQEMLPTILSLGESFLSIANSIRSAMAPAMQVVIRLFQSVVPLVDLLAKALAAVPGPIAVIAGALLLLRTRMGQALVAGVATAQGAVATGFASMRASVITFTNTLKVEMIKARTQMGALVAAARTTALGVAGAFRTMAGAVKGFMASLGPVGWALIAVTVAFEAFSSRSAEAEERAMAYKDALDQVTGAATRASTEMTIFNLMQKEVGGLYGIGARSFEDLATKANLSMADISAALHGTTAEYDAFIIRMQEAAEQGSINWAEYSLLNEALHEERSALEGARVELENKNRAEAEAAAATAAATSATVAAAIAAGNAAGPTNGLATAIGGVGSEADEAADEIAAMRTEYEGWLTVTSQISAVDKAAESIENLGTASVEFGTNLMGQTPKARDFRAEVITAFEDSAKAAQSLSDDLPTQRAIFTGELVKIVNSLKASGVKPRDIEAFLGAMDDLPASVSDIMRAAAKAVGDTDFKSQVEKAFDKSVKAGAPMTADAMERLATGASNAAKAKLGLTLEPELAGIIKSGTTALRPTAFNNGKLTGQSIGSGLANGIQASSPIVQAAVARVIAQAKAAADAAAEVGSPSRLFAETGDDISAGIGMGVARSATAATKPLTAVINTMLNQINKAFKGAEKLINNAMKGATDAAKDNLQKFLDSVTKTFDRFKERMGTLKEIAREWLSFTRGVRETTPTLESSLARVDNLYRRLEKSVNAKGKVTDGSVAATRRMAEALRNELATALDLAQANLDEVTGKFDDLRDTVSNAIKGILSFSDAKKIGEDIGGGFLEGLRIQAEKAAAFGAIIDQLRQQGLSEEALRLVIAAGAEAGTAIGSELIAGGAAAIGEANDLVDSVNAIADQIGLDTADQFYGAGVAAAQAQVEGILDQIDKMTPQIMRWMDKLAKKMRRQTVIEVKLSQDKFKVTVDVEKVIREVIAGEGTSVRATAMAAGGVVTGPTLALIGEAGPEAVIPLAQADRYGIGGGTTKTFTIENLTINAAPGERAEDTVPRALRRMAFAMGYDE